MKQPLFSTKILLLFLFVCFQTNAQRPFVGIWYPVKEYNDKVALIQVKIHLEGQYTYTWTHIQKPNINGKGSGTDSLHLFFPEEGGYRITLKPKRKNPLHRIKSGNSLRKIEQWGDVKWSTMKEAFKGATYMSMNSTDAPDLSNVADMSYMFQGTYLFNTPIGHWDVSNVTNMGGMFAGSGFNQPIDKWNVSNVTNMGGMFAGTNQFNQPLNNWDVSNAKDMSSMFSKVQKFNQPLNNWDVSNVKDMSSMFRSASVFNQPLDNWDVSNVTSKPGYGMWQMFKDAESFNQPLGNWVLNKNTIVSDMFSNSGLDCINYGLTLKGWAENPGTPSKINFNAKGMKYNKTAKPYRKILIKKKKWKFTEDEQNKCE